MDSSHHHHQAHQAQHQRLPTNDEQTRQAQLERLKVFLATAPSRWSSSSSSATAHQSQSYITNTLPAIPTSHPALNRFLLPSGEYVSCVLWSGLYHITGTDIVRALVFRFEAFGRPVVNMKKFEEGVFSDLRNLKPGTDACLEEPKSPFLDLLFKYQCIRTQKKQKVFYWFSVPHDRLFLDALERDLKREKMGQESTTVPRGEPGLSFTYDPKRTLYEQFLKPISQGNSSSAGTRHQINGASGGEGGNNHGEEEEDGGGPDDDDENEDDNNNNNNNNSGNEPPRNLSIESPADIIARRIKKSGIAHAVKTEDADQLSGTTALGPAAAGASALPPNKEAFLKMFSLFEGSPTYKQRRKKPTGSGAGGGGGGASGNAVAAVENARRRSTLASEVVSRRGSGESSMMMGGRRASLMAPASSTTTGEESISVHPSLVGNRYAQASAPPSRPISQHQHQHQQPLPNWGLSTNRSVHEQEHDEYMARQQQAHHAAQMHAQYQQQLHHSPSHMDHELDELRPSTGMSTRPTTGARPASAASTNAANAASVGSHICQLPSCRRVFPTADTLQKHLPSHAAGALLVTRWRERHDARDQGAVAREDGAQSSDGGLRFPCEGCIKVFTRAENLRLHMVACTGRQEANGAAGAAPEMEVDPYDEEGYATSANPRLNLDLGYAHHQHHQQHQQHALPHPPNSAGSTAQGQYPSAETSPYVETPENGGPAQWVSVLSSRGGLHHIPEHGDQGNADHHHHQQQQHHQHQQQQQQHQLTQANQYHPLAGIPVLSHHLSWQNLGAASGSGVGSGLTSPPDSATSQRSVFSAQQMQGLHPRYRSPDAYGYAHPSSAPSQKVAFDQGSLYPPSYQHPHRPNGMSGVSLRRYRSATPLMTGNGTVGGLRAEYHPAQQQQHADSRPASSAGGESNYDYGSVVNPVAAAAAAAAAAHPFAYSIDSGDGHGRMSYVPPGSAPHTGVVLGPGSDHSSPQSYGVAMVNGEYVESNSQYDGSNGSPGSAGGGGNGNGSGMVPMAVVEPRIMVAMPPPPRGHVHSLSSEIATQQMQQYVDLDGLAEESEQPQAGTTSAPPSYHGHGHVRYPDGYDHDAAQRYLQAEQPVVGSYHSSSSEGGHDEMYSYRFQQQASMHAHPEHSQPYPSRYYHDQRVAL